MTAKKSPVPPGTEHAECNFVAKEPQGKAHISVVTDAPLAPSHSSIYAAHTETRHRWEYAINLGLRQIERERGLSR